MRTRPTTMPGTTRPRRGWLTAALLTVAVALATLVAPAVAPTSPAVANSLGAEQRFTNLLNRSRADEGLAALEINLQMVRIARDWSEQMAAAGDISHRPSLRDHVHGPWQRIGENVGWTTYSTNEPLEQAVVRLHEAFLASPGHRANILGDYNQVGIGVVLGPHGRMWATFNFLKGPLGAFPLFVDIDGNVHEKSTEQVWVGNLARGCRYDRYCPRGAVTRAQMASFLARALQLRPVVGDRFVDVDPSSLHAGYIHALVQADIARGCTADRYCPDLPVNRAQMATFVARARQLAPDVTPTFADVPPTSSHYPNINAVAREAITAGCDSTGVRYCPGDHVRRDQMASYLARAFKAPVSFWEAPDDPQETSTAGSSTTGSSTAPAGTVELAPPTTIEAG